MEGHGLSLLGLLAAVTAVFMGATVVQAQDASINVEMNEFNIIPETSSVAAGNIEFVVTNTGAIAHQFVILQTDLEHDALPTAEGQVDRSGEGIVEVGGIEEFAGGTTESASFDLAPGNYALICDISGHYEAGMSAAFTVMGAGGEGPTATPTFGTGVTPTVAAATEPTVVAAPNAGTGGLESGGGFPVATLVAALAAAGGLVLAAGLGWLAYQSRRDQTV